MINNNFIIKKIFIFFSLFLIILLSSHPLIALLNLNVKSIFIILVGLLSILSIFFNQSIKKKLIYWIIFIIFCSIIPFFATQKFIYIQLCFFLSVVFFLSFQTQDLIFNKKTITFLYILSLLIILGAWIGCFYSKFGGVSLFEVYNIEYESQIFFYLTTFTNHVSDNYIRPSGLFDEPGSLIFFLTFVVVMMEINKFPRYQTLLLLSLSIISNSLMCLILLIIYILMYYRKYLIVVFLFSSFVIFLDYYYLNLFEHILKYTDLNYLINNNRKEQADFFFLNLDMNTFLYGHELSEKNQYVKSQTASPFSILWGYGIFISIIYFLIEFWLIYKFFFGNKKVQFSAIALFLLLLQRPYIFSIFWSFIVIYPIVALYKCENIINKHYAK